MLIDMERDGAVAIVRPHTGLVGGKETTALENTIDALIHEDNRRLLVDLRNVDALTTRGLAVLVSTHVNYGKRGGLFCLCNATKGVRNVFRITRIGDVLKLHDSFDDALNALKNAPLP